MIEISTTAEAIDKLGGIAEVARFLKREYNVVSNWRVQGHFPKGTFLILNAALNERGYSAPASLWRMPEAVQ